MVETIHPYIRLVDESPSRGSQLHSGEVERGDYVGVMLEPAFDTSEKRLTSPVNFADMSASWACFRGVPRIDVNYGCPPLKSFVFNKGLELMECPAVEVSILASPMFSPIPDSSQFLHYNHVTLFKAVHEFSADLMQNSINPSSLLSTQPFQLPFGGSCAFALERGADLPKTMPFLEDTPPFHLEAVRGYEKVVHSDVDANRVVAFGVWNLFVDGDVEEERLVSINQDCVCRLGVFQKLSLIFTYVKRGLNSLLNSGNRGVDSVRLVDKSEESLIQIHGKLIKLKKFVSSLLVGFSDSISRSDGKVSWELKLLPCFSVDHVVKSDRIKDSLFKGYFGNVIASVSKSLDSRKQLLRIHGTWLKFADSRFREFHRKAYMRFQYLRVLRFLPRLKIVGFLGGI